MSDTKSYFHDAQISYNGETYVMSAAEGQALEGITHCWYGPADPSPWLAVSVVWAVQRKFANLPQNMLLTLAAQTLGIDVSKLMVSINWVEGYTRWHDGDPDYKVLSE